MALSQIAALPGCSGSTLQSSADLQIRFFSASEGRDGKRFFNVLLVFKPAGLAHLKVRAT